MTLAGPPGLLFALLLFVLVLVLVLVLVRISISISIIISSIITRTMTKLISISSVLIMISIITSQDLRGPAEGARFSSARLPAGVREKKTLLRKRRRMGQLASKTPNRGLESSMCCRIAWPGLA